MAENAEVAEDIKTGDDGPEGEAPEINDETETEALSDAELAAALGISESDTPELLEEKDEDKGEEKPDLEGLGIEDPEKITLSKKDFEALKKKVDNQELFIQRQGTEIGQGRKLREKLEAIAAEKRALAEEQLLTNPSQAMDTHAEAREAEAGAKNAGQQESLEANRKAIQDAFPDYESRIQDIADASLEMGIPVEQVENYKRNPYATPVGILIPYVRAAVLRKHYFTKAQLADKLTSQLTELNKGHATFTKSIKAAAKRTPVIKGAGGKQTPDGPLGSLDPSQIPDLSTAELERLLKST